MLRVKSLVDVFDPDTGEHIDTHDENDSCGGPWNGYCGGCGYCMLLQASYYGYELRYHKEEE